MRDEPQPLLNAFVESMASCPVSEAVIREVREWIDHPSWDSQFPADERDDDILECFSLFTSELVSGEPPSIESLSEDIEDEFEHSSLPERFSLEHLLGAGGFGIVLCVFDRVRKQRAALKIQRPSLRYSRILQRRFLREVQVAASLDHPGILAVLETGRIAGHPYILTDVVDGPDLARLLETQRGQLSVPQAVRLIGQVAEALQFAHERGVLHRDLKPSNILLKLRQPERPDDLTMEPKLTDFGLSKRVNHLLDQQENLSAGCQVLGTLRYMAPEQAAGRFKDVGIASDVFSLGAILYHCVTGTTPYSGGSNAEVLSRILSEPVTPPRRLNKTLSKDLENIIQKCLSKDAIDRYASAGELAAELRRYEAGEPILARRAGIFRRLRYWTRLNPGLAILSALLAFVVSGSLVLVSVLYIQAQAAVFRSDRMLDLAVKGINEAYVDVAEEVLDNLPDTAEKRYQLHLKALEAHQKLAQEFGYDARSRYRLSVQYRYLGEAAGRTGRTAEFRDCHEKCITLLQGLLKEDPTNVRYQYDVFFNRKILADSDAAANPAERVRTKELVHDEICRLVEMDPKRPEFQDAAASTKMVLAKECASVKDPRTEGLFRESYSISDRLWAQYPERLSFIKYSLLARAYLADLLRDQGELNESERLCREAVEILSRVTSPGKDEIWFVEVLREPKRSLAEHCFTQGKWKEAAERLRECAAIDLRLSEYYPTFHWYRLSRSQCLANQLRAERHVGITPESERKLLEDIENAILESQKFPSNSNGISELRMMLDDTSTKPLKARL